MVDRPAGPLVPSDCTVCGHALHLDAEGRVRHREAGAAPCACPCDGSWVDPHRNPHSGDYYEALPDGSIRVQEYGTGRVGIFTVDGAWQSGDLKYADWHMVQFAATFEPIATESP